ncbi:MAG: phosphatase PAP2 family protein [Acidimicrobiia bacterium]
MVRDRGLRTWPLRRSVLVTLTKNGAIVLAIWSTVGLLYVWLLDDGPVGDADRRGVEWLEERRTLTRNSLSHYGSMLSETLVKVILVAVIGTAMVWLWRRWHDGVFLAVTVIFEATIFLFSSLIVGRERPPVTRLDDAAPTGSFPSGHAAAAVAFYVSVFVIVCWHTRNRALRFFFAVVAVAAPVIVAVSRVARGMHHPSDVIAGVLLGVISIIVVRSALAAGVEEIDRAAVAGAPLPDQVRRLDLTAASPDDLDADPDAVPDTSPIGARP